MNELQNLVKTEECLRIAISIGFQQNAPEDYLEAIDVALREVVLRKDELIVREKQRKERTLSSELKEGIDELEKRRLKKDLDVHGELE